MHYILCIINIIHTKYNIKHGTLGESMQQHREEERNY